MPGKHPEESKDKKKIYRYIKGKRRSWYVDKDKLEKKAVTPLEAIILVPPVTATLGGISGGLGGALADSEDRLRGFIEGAKRGAIDTGLASAGLGAGANAASYLLGPSRGTNIASSLALGQILGTPLALPTGFYRGYNAALDKEGALKNKIKDCLRGGK